MCIYYIMNLFSKRIFAYSIFYRIILIPYSLVLQIIGFENLNIKPVLRVISLIKVYILETGNGAWSMEHGAWSMEHEAWSLEPGAWSREHGAWSLEPGIRSLQPSPQSRVPRPRARSLEP